MQKHIILAITFLIPFVHGAASSTHTSELTTRLEQKYLGTLYPCPHTPLTMPTAAPTPSSRNSHLIIAASGALGYGAGYFTSKHLKSNHTTLAGSSASLATMLLGTALQHTIRPAKSAAATEPLNCDEPIDESTIAQERDVLSKHILPTLNQFLSDTLIDYDYAYANHKFNEQWNETAGAFLASSSEETPDTTTSPERPLADFYPEELKQHIERISTTQATSVTAHLDGDEWIEVVPADIDSAKRELIIKEYAQQAAQYRISQARSNTQAAMKRLYQLNKHLALAEQK